MRERGGWNMREMREKRITFFLVCCQVMNNVNNGLEMAIRIVKAIWCLKIGSILEHSCIQPGP